MKSKLQIAALAAAMCAGMLFATPANAAGSSECEGGGFTIVGLKAGRQVGVGDTTIPVAQLNPTFTVVGRYIEFTVNLANLGVRNYTFTGAPNPEDMTGGQRLIVWSEKTPDLRGSVLNSPVSVEISDDDITIQRSGGAASMTLSAKDCAEGGIFQMEAERRDNLTTRFTHVLAPGFFYYDNPNFRAREGDQVPFRDQMLTVPSRINLGTDAASRFVARDSAQVATRVNQPQCTNQIPKRDGTNAAVQHCGGVSIWDVSSGGRMGFVTGEDATEVAPSPTECTHQCQARNRVRGAAVVLGFPFPVPDNVRLKPRS